jgi:hypothetical protein
MQRRGKSVLPSDELGPPLRNKVNTMREGQKLPSYVRNAPFCVI